MHAACMQTPYMLPSLLATSMASATSGLPILCAVKLLLPAEAPMVLTRKSTVSTAVSSRTGASIFHYHVVSRLSLAQDHEC